MSPTTQIQPLTGNQLVAQNLRRARELRNMTQEEAAEQLEPYLGVRWSKATFSAAEASAKATTRTGTKTRPREFSADELLAFSRAFDLAIAWFFLPHEAELDRSVSCGGDRLVDTGELLEATFPYGSTYDVGARLGTIARALPAPLRSKFQKAVRANASTRIAAEMLATVGPLDRYATELHAIARVFEQVRRDVPAELLASLQESYESQPAVVKQAARANVKTHSDRKGTSDA